MSGYVVEVTLTPLSLADIERARALLDGFPGALIEDPDAPQLMLSVDTTGVARAVLLVEDALAFRGLTAVAWHVVPEEDE